nr:putative 115 kDa protein in type-1 retrotransposable element R1DM [Helicoverpa armigera]
MAPSSGEVLSLPATAADATSTESCISTLNKLAECIAAAIAEGKSVTTANKRLISSAANEIRCVAAKIPTFSAPQEICATQDGNLRQEIATCVREELSKHLATIATPLTPAPLPRSYAQAASAPAPRPVSKPPPPNKPALIVAPQGDSTSQTRQDVVQSFKNAVSFRTTSYAPSRIQAVSNNKLRVEFETEQQRDETLKKLEKSSQITAEPAKLLRPMIILKGISLDTPSEELVDVIRGQNEELTALAVDSDDLRLAFKRNNRNPKLYNAVLIAKPAIWRKIIDMGRVCVDYQRVHAEDFSTFLQCRKCLQFGHIKAKCTATQAPCSYCSEEGHNTSSCPLREKKGAPKCYNCLQHNTKFKTTHDVGHMATSNICPRCNIDRSKNSLHEFFTYFYNGQYDIALLSEPYIGSGKEVKSISGIDIYQYSRGSNVKACILVKQGRAVVLGESSLSTANLCVIQVKTDHQKMYLGSAYVEPNDDTSSTLEAIDYFLKATSRYKCILGGDFNGWHPAWGSTRSNPRGNDLMELALTNDMYVCNIGDTPTFETVTHGRDRSSIIDVTLASGQAFDMVGEWRVNLECCATSQHNAIEFNINTRKPIPSGTGNTSTFMFNTEKADWAAFRDAVLQEVALSDILDSDISSLNKQELEDLISRITSLIRDCCKETMPIRSGKAKQKPPWWSDTLQRLKGEVISLHRQIHSAKLSGQPLDALLEEQVTKKKQYSEEMKRASTENFRKFCELQTKENVWSLTNRLLKEAAPKRPPTTLKIGDRYTTDAEETASALLKHFYPDDSPDQTPEQRQLRTHFNNYSMNTPDDLPFTEEEVLEQLSSISPKKAPGLDNLTSDICHKFAKIYPRLMTDILNRCLSLQYFPGAWKEAYVKIIPKPGKDDHMDLKSFRPIGLLPVFGKLLEKLFIKRVVHKAESENKLNNNQFGFRQQRNTTLAVHTALDFIRLAKESKKHVIAVSLDIKAAFDNAWWPALFQRLANLGVPNNIYGLIKDYVRDRVVTLDHAGVRARKTLTKGCIQGSACGPVLWNMILDELLDMQLPAGCHMQAFADDVLLIVTADNNEELQSVSNTVLSEISNWGTKVKLNFGPAKTQVIAFTPKAKSVQLHMDGTDLAFVPEIKLLGIVIDEKLKFKRHLKYVLGKASRIYNKLCIYARPTWGTHPENSRTIYLHVIEPIITYAAGIWGQVAMQKSARKDLASLQRGFALKAIRAFRTVSTNAALALAQLIPLDLRILEVHQIEQTRLTNTTPFLPEDVTLERPTPARELLHPALRVGKPDLDHERTDDTQEIFTDGSKQDSGAVGAAFVCLDPGGSQQPIITKKFKLHDSCTVFQAELFAILEACKWATQKYQNTVIYTDSQASLQAIADRSNTHPLVTQIHKIIHTHRDTKNITLKWVKAHRGNVGNEAADAAAKLATLLHKTPDYRSFPMSFVKHKLRMRSLDLWQARYTSSEQGQYTKSIFPTLTDIKHFRKHTDIHFHTTQILTNHGFHKTYLHRFHITPDDCCPCNTNTPQTVTHLLTDCPRFAAERMRHEALCVYYDIVPYSLPELLKKEEALASYTELASQIYSKLKAYNGT